MNKARLQFCSGNNQFLKCTETAFTYQLLRCIANAKDFNKAGEIHCKGFVSTGQAASVEISKLPYLAPERIHGLLVSVAIHPRKCANQSYDFQEPCNLEEGRGGIDCLAVWLKTVEIPSMLKISRSKMNERCT